MVWNHAAFKESEDSGDSEAGVRNRVCKFMMRENLTPQDVQIIESRVAARPNISRTTSLTVTIYYHKKPAAKAAKKV